MNDPIPGNFQPTDEFAHNVYGMSLQQLYQQHPSWSAQWASSSINPNNSPIALAQQAQQLQIQANQPAIATLGSQQTNMQSAYGSLLQSLLGQGTVASNYAQVGENSNLAGRGILPGTQPGGNSLYNNQMSQALLPVAAQNQAAVGSVGLGSAQDLNALAAQIASLQAGNVPGALTFGNSAYSTLIGNYNQQIAGSAQVAAANAKPYTALSSGQTLGNTQTGVISFPNFGA